MKKIFLSAFVLSFTIFSYAQVTQTTETHSGDTTKKVNNSQVHPITTPAPAAKPAPQKPAPVVKEIDPEIKELMTVRDTAKAALRAKTSENRKDMNHYDRMYNKNKTWKEQEKAAKKDKKTDKADELGEKISLTTDSLKELDMKMKDDKKELSRLQKELDKAEVDLEKAKERIAKEKKKK